MQESIFGLCLAFGFVAALLPRVVAHVQNLTVSVDPESYGAKRAS